MGAESAASERRDSQGLGENSGRKLAPRMRLSTGLSPGVQSCMRSAPATTQELINCFLQGGRNKATLSPDWPQRGTVGVNAVTVLKPLGLTLTLTVDTPQH